jgi:hypothetical protein
VDLLNEIRISVVGRMKVLTPPFDSVIDVTSKVSAAFHIVIILSGGVLILARQGHVARRLPLWSGVQTLGNDWLSFRRRFQAGFQNQKDNNGIGGDAIVGQRIFVG